jgi:superfamily I DNA/RNA helicase
VTSISGRLRTLTEELDRAADLILTWAAETDAPETIAVLVREQRQRNRLVSGFAERGVPVGAVDREHIKPGQPVAMTMHQAKGTEFSKVLLFGVDQGAIPARDELALSWSGDPSRLLPAADQDSP